MVGGIGVGLVRRGRIIGRDDESVIEIVLDLEIIIKIKIRLLKIVIKIGGRGLVRVIKRVPPLKFETSTTS